VNSSADYSNSAHNLPNIQYTTDGHTDFLVSDVEADQHYRGDTPTNPDATVHLTFRHAMCMVDFKVCKQDPTDIFEIVLNTIRIDNIYFGGLYNPALGWIDRFGVPGSLPVFTGDPLDPLVLQHPDVLDPSTDPVEIPKSGEPLIMPLPQRLQFTDASLYVKYTLKRGGESTEYESEISLGTLHQLWEKDMHYTYNITINPGSPILFTANVVAWGAEQTAYYTFD
jgi:hypothetical protein